jgi:glc operon protein GlcG
MKIIKIKTTVFITAMLFIAVAANAQSPQKNITLESAKAVVAEAVKYARSVNAPGGAIAVAFAAASEVATKKANTSALFKAPSSKLENSINGGRGALITVGHTFLQGGIPILFEGQVIGAIGVSGSASAQQDEDMANAGAKATLK